MRLRFIMLSVCALIGSSTATAQQTEEQAIDKAIACREIDEPLERLACLDKAAETLAFTRIIREEEVAEKKREQRENFGLAKSDVDKAPDTVENFGSEAIVEVRRDRDDKKLKSIESKVVEIRINKLGKVTLTLENGQVWRQLRSDNKTLRLPRSEQLYTARIKRSIVGNYMLTVPELKRTIRVSRVE